MAAHIHFYLPSADLMLDVAAAYRTMDMVLQTCSGAYPHLLTIAALLSQMKLLPLMLLLMLPADVAC
jgi:hypothetical protein